MDNIDEKSRITQAAGRTVKDRMAKIKNFADEDVNYWYDANFNPFGKNTGDCMIRAVSAAIMMRYECVCARLGYRFKDGHGLERQTGASHARIMNSSLRRYFEPVDKDAMMIGNGIPLRDFVFIASMSRPGNGYGQGLYVAFAVNPKTGTGHAVYVCAEGGDMFFIDTFDSSDYTVYDAFKVKRQVGKNNPERLKYGQFKTIQALYREKSADLTDMFDIMFDQMFGGRQEGVAEYEIDDQMREWLEADSKNEMLRVMRGISAKHNGLAEIVADAAGKPTGDRIRTAAKLLNGEYDGKDGGFPYSLKPNAWFGDAYAEDSYENEELPTLFVDLNTKRDITDTAEWKRLKDRSFAVMKDLGLENEIESVIYRQDDERGVVWFQFAS